MDSKSAGLGVLDVLQIIFIVLKLCHVISWSWWVVFTPLLIELGVLAIFLIVWIICIVKNS